MRPAGRPRASEARRTSSPTSTSRRRAPCWRGARGPTGSASGAASTPGARLALQATNDASGSSVGGDFFAIGRNAIQTSVDIVASGSGVNGVAGTITLSGAAQDPQQVSGNITIGAALRTLGDAGTVSSGGGI